MMLKISTSSHLLGNYFVINQISPSHFISKTELHAVKYTNAKLDGISRIDPDEVAATAEVLFYAGEIKKFECHGKFKYQVVIGNFVFYIRLYLPSTAFVHIDTFLPWQKNY